MMRTSLDVATGKPGPVPAELTVLAGKLRAGLDQAGQLVENLLLLARAQYGASDGWETIPLGPLLAAATGARAGQIASMSLHLQHTPAGGGGPLVTGNPVLLVQMTGNLIDNAVRHNQPGGWIGIQVTRDGPVVRLLVEKRPARPGPRRGLHLGPAVPAAGHRSHRASGRHRPGPVHRRARLSTCPPPAAPGRPLGSPPEAPGEGPDHPGRPAAGR